MNLLSYKLWDMLMGRSWGDWGTASGQLLSLVRRQLVCVARLNLERDFIPAASILMNWGRGQF